VIVGLTGGVGAGKSTVARLFAERGAVVIDADVIAREVVEPGTAGYDAVVTRFGPAVVASDGGLDRAALAEIVFADAAARTALNEIVHPLVGQRSAQLMADAPSGAIIVYDVPLLAESRRRAEFDVVVVVEARLEVRLARLAQRGMPERQARARVAAQASDDERRVLADHVIDNSGSRAQLAEAIEAVWRKLCDQGGVERGAAVD
jgi:dephospho-CoA kinase